MYKHIYTNYNHRTTPDTYTHIHIHIHIHIQIHVHIHTHMGTIFLTPESSQGLGIIFQ